MDTTTGRSRSTADARRATVLTEALRVFAKTGYHATPVSDVAAAADISQGYVIRLFRTKLDLFVAVIETCFEQIVAALDAGSQHVRGGEPQQVLDAMSDAYVELIADRDLLMLQVHAQSASDIPEVRLAMQRGLARVTELASDRSHATPEQVQRFVAYGQLCHLIVTADLDHVDGPWARTLTHGVRHLETFEGGGKP
ncbi:TetR/AcrR family transcriptional regulator [Nocardioides sp. BP30]|uniref:TetR/AcrR family transcriptional regulator n=1 Tax=Nocardioides sp. BP30 TaxID=3036374 RepID=UPI00246984FE|nr:TetR/AcrR family transcriptional regulator [Nocardioides sp. BP30]WGL50623.1 TetR/AcrR family transcriptional regulator [Nocardioides sp. BP30]